MNTLQMLRDLGSIIFLALSISLQSCYQDYTCRQDFIGTFSVYLPHVDSVYHEIIYERGWDTVNLTSKSNGDYYFNTDDPILKEIEGSWHTESINIEGDCIGYIKQHNLRAAVPVAPFYLSVFILDSIKFTLPFRKTSK
jgi:hypothetical protein